jgi:hypothetical protein
MDEEDKDAAMTDKEMLIVVVHWPLCDFIRIILTRLDSTGSCGLFVPVSSSVILCITNLPCPCGQLDILHCILLKIAADSSAAKVKDKPQCREE